MVHFAHVAASCSAIAISSFASTSVPVFWEPIPFDRGGERRLSPGNVDVENQRLEKKEKLRIWKQELDAREAAVSSAEAAVAADVAQRNEWADHLDGREQRLARESAEFRAAWALQERSLHHLMIFRHVRIQAAAARVECSANASTCDRSHEHFEPAAVDSNWQEALIDQVELPSSSAAARFAHPRWGNVEVLVCVPRSQINAIVGDIPILEMFRGSTPLLVRNLCEDVEDENYNQHQLVALRRIAAFCREAHSTTPAASPRSGYHTGRLPTLYYVVTSVYSIFNAPPKGDDAAGLRAAREIVDRYEGIVAEASLPARWPAIVAAEPLCPGEPVGDKLVGEEDAIGGQRLIELSNAASRPDPAGMIGPADSLEVVVSGMLRRAEADSSITNDPSMMLLRHMQNSPDTILIDHAGRLFGSLLEVESNSCHSTPSSSPGTSYKCAPGHCNPVNSIFERLHEPLLAMKVEGCTVKRRGDLPISWHADGRSKWTYLLVLERLSVSCQRVARMMIQSLPNDFFSRMVSSFVAPIEGDTRPPEV